MIVQEFIAEPVQSVGCKSMQYIFQACCRVQAKVSIDLQQGFNYFVVRKYVKDSSLYGLYHFWCSLCMKCPKLGSVADEFIFFDSALYRSSIRARFVEFREPNVR